MRIFQEPQFFAVYALKQQSSISLDTYTFDI